MKLPAIHSFSSISFSLLAAVSAFAAGPAQPSLDVPTAATAPAVVIPANVAGQPAANNEKSTDLLDRVRVANEELFSNLQSFVCNEQMERFKGSVKAESGKHIDSVTAKVSFENGIEHYSDILQNKRQRTNIWDIQGAWSEGEFGTLLRQTQQLLSTQTAQFERYADLNGTASAVYSLEVASENSPWDLTIESHHYHIAFRTEIWVNRTSGEILKIERTSNGIPPTMGISEISWGVTLQQVQLNGKTWLLPQTGDYSVSYALTGHREWNQMSFSNYHRYGSEVALSF